MSHVLHCGEPKINRDGSRSSGIGGGGHSRDFWAKVRKLEGEDGCWEWIGYLDKDGYGKLCTFVDGRRRSFRAHRYAWERENGPVPAGKLLMHRCDNRKCVRPSHLQPGTQAENILDCIRKGRWGESAFQHGEWSPRAILNDEAVLEIRGYRGVRGAPQLLAALYGVALPTLYAVLYGHTWKHVRGRPHAPMPLERLRELVAQRGANDAPRPRQLQPEGPEKDPGEAA